MEIGDFTVTGVLLIVTSIFWFVWDVIAYRTKRITISQYIRSASYYSPSIPFIIGLLCGHWFW